ncbi:DMT family transporter [Algicella marina]|uniref:DMT family transporter n=1 Tax=Algicella marina TaxID=2683284 RepID=UPI0024DF92A6|nr:DMT family transporter [Algicella marina]
MAKLLVTAIPPLQVVFFRYAGAFIFALVAFLPTEGLSVFQSRAPRLQVARAILLVSSTFLNFLALKYLPLTVTTAIFFASPVVVCLLSIPLLGERVGIRRLSAVFTGFIGVLVITRPGGTEFHPAMAFSVGALVCASLYFVLTRMVAGRDDNPTGQVITTALPSLVLLPLVLPGWVWPEGWLWAPAVVIGLFGGLGHSLFTVGHRYGEASVLAPLVYIQIIYATAIGWLVFSQPPSGNTILGTGVIVASGLYLWLRERKRKG